MTKVYHKGGHYSGGRGDANAGPCNEAMKANPKTPTPDPRRQKAETSKDQ